MFRSKYLSLFVILAILSIPAVLLAQEKADSQAAPAVETKPADGDKAEAQKAPAETVQGEAASNENEAVEEESNEDEAAPACQMGEVVVSASRNEEEPFHSNRSVDVLSNDEIKQRVPRTVPEALRESPGVFVQQTNHGGGSPVIRGMVGPQILLLVDGVRLNNSVYRTGPLQYLNMLDSYQIKRLEVVRGPGSVLYGSDAMGGVINAITLLPNDRRGLGFGANGRGALKYASANTEKTVHALADMGYEGFGFNGGVTFKDFGNLRGGDSVGEQPYTSYDQLNVGTKFMARLKEGFTKDWHFSMAYQRAMMNDVGRADKLFTKDSYNLYNNDDDLLYGKAHMIFRPINTKLDLTLSYQHFFEQKDSIKLDPNHTEELKRSRDHITVNTIGMDSQFQTELLEKRLNFTYGVEVYRDWVSSSRKERGLENSWADAKYDPFPEGSRYRLIGAFLTARGEILPLEWDWRLALTAGYRVQQMAGHADAREGAEETDYSHISHVGTAGIQTSYKDNWMTSFNWSQGFRAPNLNESILIGDTGEFFHITNDSLGPEMSDTLELLTRFDAWHLYGSAAGYISFIHDVIKRVPTTFEGQEEILDKTVAWNINGASGRMYGFEGMLGADLTHGLSTQATVTYTYGVEKIDDAADIPLPKVPPVFGDWRLRWEGKASEKAGVFVETYILFAGKQDRLSEEDVKDVRIPQDGTPGWVTWNIRGGVCLHEHYRFGLTVENLTNEKYKYHASGVYGAGTNAILTLDLDF